MEAMKSQTMTSAIVLYKFSLTFDPFNGGEAYAWLLLEELPAPPLHVGSIKVRGGGQDPPLRQKSKIQ